MPTVSGLLRKALRALAFGICGLLVLVAGVVVLGLHLNAQAEAEAAALCSQLRPGIAEDEALAIARMAGSRHLPSSAKHEFRFQGWIFNATSCEISIEAGKVSAVAVVELGD
jgi:hypothetical protein